MYSFERATQQKTFHLFSIFLLVFSLLSSAIPAQITHATGTSNERPDHGKINNEEDEIDYDRATINKQVDFGNKPGEYFIDLTVKGKDNTQIDTTDIVIPYDLSNSMENNNVPGTNRTRTEVAAEATTDFINGLLGPDRNLKIAFVPYGTSIMDGETRSYLGNPGRYTFNQINPFNYYVGNFTSNANDITSKIPSSINHGNHGGTFTQQALERAGEIIATSNADNKIIVTITDGLPTISYNNSGQSWGTGTENQGNQNMQAHRTNTINEANGLKNDYTLYSIGVGLSSNSPDETEVLEGIARTPDDAYFANTVQELVDALTEISQELSDSVVNGTIQDPITEEFILKEGQAFTEASNEDLTDGEYYVTASDSNLLNGVTVTTEGQQVKVDGLNLGKDEWINIRYKVQIDTDNLDLDPNELYKTNGTTTLTPRGDNPDETNEFPEPEASTVPIEVAGEKIWVDFGYKENRPDEIIVQLIREINGEEHVVKEVTVESDGTDVWEYKFDDVFLYDTNGDPIEYKVKEILPEGYDEHYESDSDGTNLTNVLKNN